MGVKNPYTPAPYPALDATDTDLPPEVKAQLDYARALGKQAQPVAEPEAPAPGVRVPFLNRTIPGRFIDAASPALLSALRSRGPAVRAGKNHDLANVASVIGQAYLGSRVSGAQDRARAHAEDLALAKEQRAYQQEDKRDAVRNAASMLASYRQAKLREGRQVLANQQMVDAAPELGMKVGDPVPPNALGTIMQRLNPKRDGDMLKVGASPNDPMRQWLKSHGMDAAPGEFTVKRDASTMFYKPPVGLNPMLSSTPEAIDYAAKQYLDSGGTIVPPMARGNTLDRKNFMDRVAQMARGDNMSLAERRMMQKGLGGSYLNIRKNLDSISAFENTAIRNSDRVISAAQNMIDTGSPLLNKPIRDLSRGMFGDSNVVLYDVARTVTSPEFARILQSANGNGVLTDSARKEVESLLGPGATLENVVKAINLLKQDAATRKESLNEQLALITETFRASGLSPTGSKPQMDPLFPKKLETKLSSILKSAPSLEAAAAGVAAVKAEADSADISPADWEQIKLRAKPQRPTGRR